MSGVIRLPPPCGFAARVRLEIGLARQCDLDDVAVGVAARTLERLNIQNEAIDRRNIVDDLIAGPTPVDGVVREELGEVEVGEGLSAVDRQS